MFTKPFDGTTKIQYGDQVFNHEQMVFPNSIGTAQTLRFYVSSANYAYAADVTFKINSIEKGKVDFEHITSNLLFATWEPISFNEAH